MANAILEGLAVGGGLAQKSADARQRRWRDMVASDQFDRGLAFKESRALADDDYRDNRLDQEYTTHKEALDQNQAQYESSFKQRDYETYLENTLQYDKMAQQDSHFVRGLTSDEKKHFSRLSLDRKRMYIHERQTRLQREQQYSMHKDNITESIRSQDSSQEYGDQQNRHQRNWQTQEREKEFKKTIQLKNIDFSNDVSLRELVNEFDLGKMKLEDSFKKGYISLEQANALIRISAGGEETRLNQNNLGEIQTDQIKLRGEIQEDLQEDALKSQYRIANLRVESNEDIAEMQEDGRNARFDKNIDYQGYVFGKAQENAMVRFREQEQNLLKRHGDNYKLSQEAQTLQQDKFDWQVSEVKKLSSIQDEEKKVKQVARMLNSVASNGTDEGFANVFNTFVQENPEQAAEIMEAMGMELTEGQRGISATDNPAVKHIMIAAVDGGFVLGSPDGKSMQTGSGVPGSAPVVLPSDMKFKLLEMLNTIAQDETVATTALGRKQKKTVSDIVDNNARYDTSSLEGALGRNQTALGNARVALKTAQDTPEPETPVNPLGGKLVNPIDGYEAGEKVRLAENDLARTLRLQDVKDRAGNRSINPTTIRKVTSSLETFAEVNLPEAQAEAKKQLEYIRDEQQKIITAYKKDSSGTAGPEHEAVIADNGFRRLEKLKAPLEAIVAQKATPLGVTKAKEMTAREWNIASLSKKVKSYETRVDGIQDRIVGTKTDAHNMKNTIAGYISLGIKDPATMISRALKFDGVIDPLSIQMQAASQAAAIKKSDKQQKLYREKQKEGRKEMIAHIKPMQNSEDPEKRAFYESYTRYEGFNLPGSNVVMAGRLEKAHQQLYRVNGGFKNVSIPDAGALTQLSSMGYFMDDERKEFTDDAAAEFSVVNKTLRDAYDKGGYSQHMDYNQFVGVVIDGADGIGGMRAKVDAGQPLSDVMASTIQELGTSIKR